jgi:hypothetical protein
MSLRLTTRLAGLLAAGGLTMAPLVARPEPVFRASAILEHRAPGAPPRVRFEWSPRNGVAEYLLVGAWTPRGAWTVRGSEYRVTRQNATSWSERQITFEVSLLPGSYSWKLLPVPRAKGLGDAAAAAHLTFDLP